MSSPRCQASTPCTFHEVPLDQVEILWDGPAVGRKALAYPKRGVIFLDRQFFNSISTTQGRAGILAHERGHLEGARCEPCADFRGGEILRREGWTTSRDAQATLISKLDNRGPESAAAELGRGFGLDGGHLLNRERAAGVDAELQGFLDELDETGIEVDGVVYDVTVGVDGGVRTDGKQLELYAKGRELQPDGTWLVVDQAKVVTNAKSSATGKHGQAKAIDLWVMLNGAPLLYATQAPALFQKAYAELGRRGEARGLVWGGRWTSLVDLPHFEVGHGLAAAAGVAGGVILLVLLLLVTA